MNINDRKQVAHVLHRSIEKQLLHVLINKPKQFNVVDFGEWLVLEKKNFSLSWLSMYFTINALLKTSVLPLQNEPESLKLNNTLN